MRSARCRHAKPHLTAASLLGAMLCAPLLCAQVPPMVPPDAPAAPTAAPPTTRAPRQASLSRPVPMQQTPEERLSTAWMQRLLALVADEDISAEGLESVMDIAQACGGLTPNRPAPWRTVMYLADQLEITRPELAIAARRTALTNLARLEPLNDSVTLARLTDAIESHGTAEERVRGYELLLSDANSAKLGAPIRSRLAYQLAMLQNRMGNTELFARWLGESVKLDPAFPQATLAAAGFFRARMDDPAADVELLSIAAEANPRDLQTWSALITVLLNGGAFKGAERAARDALVVADQERLWSATNNLTCDLATALWGQGKRSEAQRELKARLVSITEDYRRRARFSDSTLSPERIAALYPPLPPSLTLGALALAQGKESEAARELLVEQGLALNEQEIEVLRKTGVGANIDPLLEKATLAVLFQKDPSKVGSLLEDAAKEHAISATTLARFTGLLEWRTGKLDAAIARLEPLRTTDPLARFGYASALVDSGRVQDGAREFLELAKTRVGSTLGLVALERLATVLEKEVLLTSQLSPAIADRAQRMEAALTANLPTLVDDMMAHPMRMLSATVKFGVETAGPFTALPVNITLRNLSRMPLAIGRTEPIISRIVMRTNIQVQGETTPRQVPNAVIPFDQRLQLAPGATIEFTMDASLTPMGRRMSEEPLSTHLVSPEFVINPRETDYGAMPGFLGSAVGMIPFPVVGVQVTPQWIAESTTLLAGPRTSDSALRLVLLAHAAAAPEKAPEASRAALGAPEIWKTMADAWVALEPLEQAWVVAVLPKETAAMAPLLDAVRTSTSPGVLTSWLLSRVTVKTDPMLDVARRTTDPRLVRLADAVAWTVERTAKRAIEDLSVGGRKMVPVPPPKVDPNAAPSPTTAPSTSSLLTPTPPSGIGAKP